MRNSRFPLKSAFEDYIQTQCTNPVHELEFSSYKYSCWSISTKNRYTVHNWIGEYMGSGIYNCKLYIWLGKRGAVYVTNSPSFKKDSDKYIRFIVDMKEWVWNKYYL